MLPNYDHIFKKGYAQCLFIGAPLDVIIKSPTGNYLKIDRQVFKDIDTECTRVVGMLIDKWRLLPKPIRNRHTKSFVAGVLPEEMKRYVEVGELVSEEEAEEALTKEVDPNQKLPFPLGANKKGGISIMRIKQECKRLGVPNKDVYLTCKAFLQSKYYDYPANALNWDDMAGYIGNDYEDFKDFVKSA